jgi:hypothetical protein
MGGKEAILHWGADKEQKETEQTNATKGDEGAVSDLRVELHIII